MRTSWEASWRIVGTRGTLMWDGEDDIRAADRWTTRNALFDETIPLEVPPL